MSGKANDRRYPRIACSVDKLEDEEYPFNRVVKNISREGCFIETDEALDIGQECELSIAYPPGRGRILRRGEIVWELRGRREDAHAGIVHGYGVRFIDIDPKAAASLMDAVIYFKVNGIL